jgi:diaminopimelate decarboxylase
VGEGLLGVTDEQLGHIADRVGTPVYVYSAEAFRRQWALLLEALGSVPHRVHYSAKANSNLAVLSLMRELGAGLDIVSGGELARGLVAGFDPEQVVFSGVGKTRAELERAIAAGVGLINMESEEELAIISQLAQDFEHPTCVGVRVNPDVPTTTHPYTQTGAKGMKFGVPLDRVLPLATRVNDTPFVTLTSIGMHIGSQIVDAGCYREAATKIVAVIDEVRHAGIDTLQTVDVGGGLGVSYGAESAIDVHEFARAVAIAHDGTGLRLLVEPGRFLAGNSGALLTRVLYRKLAGGRAFIVVDAGMNDFIRPSYYQAMHDVRVVRSGTSVTDDGPVDVVGPLCESGDFLALRRQLAVGTDGVLLILGTGAYGFSMSSTYNSRPRSAEVMVDGDRWGVIRRRERVEDLWRGESVEPQWTDG